MRAVVVGAGAWGLPTAAELVRRGHEVVLVDRYGIAPRLGSSTGPTRIWRLAHEDLARVQLAKRSVAAWERLERLGGERLLMRTGLLWRGTTALRVSEALTAAEVPHDVLDPDDVGSRFPGLVPNFLPAVWSADGGPVLAAAGLGVQEASFRAGGGRFVMSEVSGIDLAPGGVRVATTEGTLEADVVVVAPGPGAVALLPGLGVELAFRPVLAQVSYFDGPGAEELPALVEFDDETIGAYAMATPGRGYKMGIEHLRELVPGDVDRTPDAGIVAETEARVAQTLPALEPAATGTDVCTWTESPDLRFVIDRVAGGRVVVAAGDSGEGFKFSALFGELLADLAEGRDVDPDLQQFGLARFAPGAGGGPR